MEEEFTVVFRGDPKKIAPWFLLETEFGQVVAVGIGNAYDEIESLTEELAKWLEE